MKRRAFTLVELLVVIAIIAILIAILIPTLGKAREITLRTTCAANLKSQGSAFAIYAGSNGDWLPVPPVPTGAAAGGILHLNQLDSFVTRELLSQPVGSTASKIGPKWFFCPANNTMAPATLGNTGSVTLGYAYTIIRAKSNDLTMAGPPTGPLMQFESLPTINPALRPSPPLSYHDKWSSTPFSSQVELGLDMIIRSPNPNFSDPVSIGGLVSSTNHMASDTYPRGANRLFFDGHVSFQVFGGPPAPTADAVDSAKRVGLRMYTHVIFYFPAP